MFRRVGETQIYMKFYNERPRAHALSAPAITEQTFKKKAYLSSTISNGRNIHGEMS
jgi:hypothetical protein